MPRPRIIYAGTPDFAVAPLKALIEADCDLIAVYTQPDRPAGRGRKLTPSPVKQTAIDAGIPVMQPRSLKDTRALDSLRTMDADLMVVAAYGLLLPQAALDVTRLGCVNVHASILPRWRGAAPIQRAIAAGDRETGISIMQMEAGLDTGPVYLVKRIPIAPNETGGSLHDRLAPLGAEALMDALPGVLDGSLTPSPQHDGLASYAKKLTKEEAQIDWTCPAVEIERLVRAFDPWPVAQTSLASDNLRIWAAHALTRPAEPDPGRVVATGKDGIDVSTGTGLLRITRLQAPGKRPMSARDYINARSMDGALFA